MKNISLVIFLLVAAAQLYIPAQMVWSSENVLTEGELFKFKTAPVDPNDPFRGKYVTLRFAAETYRCDTLMGEPLLDYNGNLYAALTTDAAGYAKVIDLREVPPADVAYLTIAEHNHYSINDSIQFNLKFPFKRYYMEENKAPAAERLFIAAARDRKSNTYALVRIKDGVAVLEDVEIDGVSLRDLAEEELNSIK